MHLTLDSRPHSTGSLSETGRPPLPLASLIHQLGHDALAFVDRSFSLQGLVTAVGDQVRWICHRSSPSVFSPWRADEGWPAEETCKTLATHWASLTVRTKERFDHASRSCRRQQNMDKMSLTSMTDEVRFFIQPNQFLKNSDAVFPPSTSCHSFEPRPNR